MSQEDGGVDITVAQYASFLPMHSVASEKSVELGAVQGVSQGPSSENWKNVICLFCSEEFSGFYFFDHHQFSGGKYVCVLVL